MLPNVNLVYYEKSFFLHYLGMENLVDRSLSLEVSGQITLWCLFFNL